LFVPDAEAKQLMARVQECRQRMGSSSITFGDDGGKVSYPPKVSPPKVAMAKASSPMANKENKQRHFFGESSIKLWDESPAFEKPKARQYPGNHHLGFSKMNTICVPPENPSDKIVTKLGEEHLGVGLQPPAVVEVKFPSKMLNEHLSKAMEAPVSVATKIPTQMCKESEQVIVPQEKVETKWLASEIDAPLPPAPARREYPNGLAFNKPYGGEEMQPAKIKRTHPEGQQLGFSHIGHLGESEVTKGDKRGTYTHSQGFGKTSEPAVYVRRSTIMGSSSIQLG
jgi:hypothetical protein